MRAPFQNPWSGTLPIENRKSKIENRIFCALQIAVLVLAAVITLPLSRAAEPNQDTVSVDSETDAVIHGALEYLAKEQGINGAWTQAAGMAREPVALTGYALMAFLSTGNLPDEGEYGRNVSSGMQFLLNQIQPDGLFREVAPGKYMYSHGIATVALSEIYGQTRSPVLRQRLEQIVNVIITGQSQTGGWRYKPDSRDADISVTVLQVAALRAAKNAGLSIPQDTINRAVDFINSCYNEEAGGFAYQPHGPPAFARTAAAIYSLQVCGKYDDPSIMKGSDYIFAHGGDGEQWWPYGCYYAAPAEYMIGGDTWRRWYTQMKTRLMSTVIKEGSVDYWDEKRSQNLGPIYDTSVFVTVLAMPYHYIPLYQR
jgi:prenyltransferase beta subunit